ncbi:MAG: hypothetical protein JW738_09885 [Actinobacteria bacterium]|nr:hypothetical protein [Actinomycetota bacterium]
MTFAGLILAAGISLCRAQDVSVVPESDRTYTDIGGMVIIEAETAPMDGEWTVQTTEPADTYTGAGFVVAGGFGELVYRIKFTTPAVYRMLARTTQIGGDGHNDSFVKMEGPQFEAFGNGNWYDPSTEGGGVSGIDVDVGKAPLPWNEGGYYKMSTHTSGFVWSWQSTNADEGLGIWYFFHFDIQEAGEYTLHLKKRSSEHKIDRFVLFTYDVNWEDAINLDLQPTYEVTVPVIQRPQIRLCSEVAKAYMFDLLGRRIFALPGNRSADRESLSPVRGIYVTQISDMCVKKLEF